MNSSFSNNDIYPRFDRKFLESGEAITSIGDGSLGGKASGLAFINKTLQEKISPNEFPDVLTNIPRMVVIRTDVFDAFMSRNNLYEIAYSDEPDEHIAMAFIDASLPAEILGDLCSLVENIHVPLAVRSSSMLEDAKHEPFAGIYATKMIPNNQPDPDQKFIVLREAIKFVYASTFFKAAKDYFKVSSHSIQDEKMAVIIQEVVGQQYYDRFYPNFSGVARSFNYYPAGRSKPEHGVVNLALGLGKTIVDGGLVWSYSPLSPKSGPPFGDPYDMMKNTQTTFWVVNMNPVSVYNPAKETEYMSHLSLTEADYDSTMKYIASTYDVSSQRIVLGVGVDGPRVLNFAPLLGMNEFRFNDLVRKLLRVCEEALSSPVEIEFAVSVLKNEQKIKFGFLQVRPMVVPDESIELEEKELFGEDVLLASDRAMGNGIVENILDVVFVKPETFDKKDTLKISEEIDLINRELVAAKKNYVLIGFGRWGSSDPWLGIPVEWSQIAGAKVIVESTLFGINVELSQGSHFFHNLTSFKVNYFSITFDGQFRIDWKWLDNQKVVREMNFVKHVRLEQPLKIKIDGRKSRGVIKKW